MNEKLVETILDIQNKAQLAQLDINSKMHLAWLALLGSIVVAAINAAVLIYGSIRAARNQKDLEERKAQLSADNARLVADLQAAVQAKIEQQRAEYVAENERLKSYLLDAKAELDARRDYEYEARKRLYTEFEPLLFQLIELSERLQHRVKSLARAARRGEILPNGKGWLENDDYYLRSTLYELLAPLVIYRLLRKALTLVDLAVDARIEGFFGLAKQLYISLTDDFDFASAEPAVKYTPHVDDWKTKRMVEPSVYWRQGVSIGRLDAALDLLIADDGKTIVSFGHFEKTVYPSGSAMTGLFDVFTAFHPQSRPILWRLLIGQTRICEAILQLRTMPGWPPPNGLLSLAVLARSDLYEYACPANDPVQQGGAKSATSAAEAYLRQRMK